MGLIIPLIWIVLVCWFLYALVTTIRVMRRKVVSEGWSTLMFIGVVAVSCGAPVVWVWMRIFDRSLERLDQIDPWVVDPQPEKPAPLEMRF